MRRLLLFVLLGLAISVAIDYILNLESGYVYIGAGDWRIEMSLLMLILLTLGSAVALFAILVATGKLVNVSIRAGSWIRNSKVRSAEKKTQAGLVAYLEGNWTQASKLLKSSASHAENPVINYLAAAHSASELGQTKEAEQFLLNAYSYSDESDFAVGLTKARLTLEQGDYETSLATLIRLKAIKPHDPSVLKLLRRVYLKLEDWNQLIQLLPELKKIPGETPRKLAQLEEEIWRKLFLGTGSSAQAASFPRSNADELADLWQRLPHALRFETDILTSYASQLMSLGEAEEAEALLRKMLNKQWDDKLVELYGCLETNEPKEQLIVAEKWLKERPNNAFLLLALGKIALRSDLFGKAQEYLSASQSIDSNTEVCAEICRLDLYLREHGYGGKLKEEDQIRHLRELVNSLKLKPAAPASKSSA